MSEKKLASLLSRPGTAIAGLAERARRIEALTGAVAAALPADMRTHLLSAALDDEGTLTLVTESSAWAARLRFAADDAMAAARDAGHPANTCRVTVRPQREADRDGGDSEG